MDLSIAEKKAYDFLIRQEEAKRWIEELIQESLPPGTANFGDNLRDGIALAKLGKIFAPTAIKKINTPKSGSVLEFMAVDNISQFFEACKKVNFPDHYIFACQLLTRLFQEVECNKLSDVIVKLSEKYYKEISPDILRTYTNCFTLREGVELTNIKDFEGRLKLDNAIQKFMDMIIDPKWGIKNTFTNLLITSISVYERKVLDCDKFKKVLTHITDRLENPSMNPTTSFSFLEPSTDFPDYWELVKTIEELKKLTKKL
ncbi:calponin homology domain-containing protein [Naegleria gruberi]|uniref:Calponin homology domain-containing protein n=1 Tax=Naegleria gruberi TaxID=5762 RepID=D2W574_NAEGR|nr:calponin homology domain-containing protein [Naegleria gruberi]EFC35778.1 calponin homology domain-containing protein [Naegleria gruberi]|eukprot:XP_002668522.1 calponin homology domain-containing protein [Naegleria gruberi strain NEG-M]